MTEPTTAPPAERITPDPRPPLPPIAPPMIPPGAIAPPMIPPGVTVSPPGPPRRRLRAVLRWTSAALVFGALAGGTGYGLTLPERARLPGLATEDDGRWDYPELKRPALAAGAPGPFEETRNPAGNHHADLRRLLLPAPAGARADKKLAGRDGWLPTAGFLEEYAEDDRAKVRQELVDDSCRHIAARGWTMPDGTRTRIYLLQFNSGGLATRFHNEALSSGLEPGAGLVEAPLSQVDESWPDGAMSDYTDVQVYDEAKPYGKRQARHAYVVAGDVVALVVHSKAGTAAKVPFQQTLVLQGQLLG